MKRKKKLIIWVLSVLLVGGAGLVLAGKLVIDHRAANRKHDGIAASIAGDHERASQLLARYLQRHPHDDEALAYYVKSSEQAEHLGETLAALKMLVADRPDSLDDRRHLLELYDRFDRRPEAIDAADAILANKQHPDWAKDVGSLAVKTDVLRRLQRNRDALDTAQQWAKVAPLDIKAHMARLALEATLHHPQQSLIADATALRLAHPGDPRFELLQGYAYGVGSDVPDAYKQASDWTSTAAGHPDLPDDVAQLVVTQFDQLGLPDKSLAMLETLAKRGAGPEMQHTLGKRLWELGRWEPAAAALADVNPQDPASDSTLVAMKAIDLANLGKTAEANAARSALADRKQASAKAWVLLLRRIVDAAQLDDKQVIAACRSALALEPQNPYLAYYLGDANMRLGEIDQAITAWRVAESEAGTWSTPGIRLVEALLQTNHLDQAQAVANDAARRNHSAGAVIALARAYASGNAVNAEQIAYVGKLVDTVQAALPFEERTLLIRIEWLCRQDKKSDARSAASAAISRQPAPSEQFLLALADKSRQYALNLQQDCFAACKKAHGITPGLAYAQAIDRFLAGQKQDALKGFDADAKAGGKPEDRAWKVARAQCLDFISSPDAKAAWIALGDAYPKDVAIQHAQADARCMQGDWDAMQKVIDRLKDLTGETGTGWRLAKARLMVESPRTDSDYEQGSLVLSDLLKHDPNNTQAHELLARALVHMKRIDGAIEQLSIAANEDSSSVPIALELASLLQSRGDFERVQQELDRITPSIHSPIQRQQAAALLAQQGNSDRAVDLLVHPTSQPGEDTQAKPDLLLAELYRRQRQFDKADQVIKTLMEQPNLATIRFAASLYFKEGRPADAQAALARLDELKLDPGIKELALGAYYAESGDLQKAIEHYQTATTQAPANPVAWRILATSQVSAGKADDAMATIAKAVQAVPADKALDAIHRQADLLRQAAAVAEERPVVLVVMNDPLNSDIALELLHLLEDARGSNDVQRLASQLQQLTERHPDFLPAQLQLIQCLASMGRISDAMTAAQRAMNLFPSLPDPARAAVQLSAATGHWPEMEKAAQTWRARLPDDPLPADLAIAQARIQQHQDDGALSQLAPYEASASAQPDRFSGVITQRCLALIHSGQQEQAAAIVWPLTSKSAGWRVQWIRLAAEIPDVAQAAAWIDRVVPSIPADAVIERVTLAEALGQLGIRAKDPAITQRSTDAFAALTADPKAAPEVLLAAATAAERRSDWAGAEPLYRRALALNPKLWIAQNNLAMLIVRRRGNAAEAASLASAAARLQPRQPTVLDTLAQVEAEAGNPSAAAKAEQSALQLDPDNVKWRVRLTQFLVDSGQVSEAKLALQRLDSSRIDSQRFSPDDQTQMQQQIKRIRIRLGGNGSAS